MYSPKISEELVPALYRWAKEQKMPMTRLVDGILREALADRSQSVNSPDTESSLDMWEIEPAKAAA